EANFFEVLGIRPQLGRTFAAGEDKKGANQVAILSNSFWKSHFGGSRDVVNRTVSMNGESHTIVGVMPARYRQPAEAQMWIPMDMSPETLGQRGSLSWRAIGRVRDDVT